MVTRSAPLSSRRDFFLLLAVLGLLLALVGASGDKLSPKLLDTNSIAFLENLMILAFHLHDQVRLPIMAAAARVGEV